MPISEHIASLGRRIEAAARRSGRSPQEIHLMAVTKTVAADQIREAHAAGIRLFGENRVQEFAAKIDRVRDLEGAEWHMIGHLQTNKLSPALELFAAIDSLDSLRLAERLNARAVALGRRIPVLIEINIGGEKAKSGVAPHSVEFASLLAHAPLLPSLEFRGLMTVPPYTEDPEHSRPYFRKMRELFTEIARRRLPSTDMRVLSMGMSHDFEVAVEEGATVVRIGAALFGRRPPIASKP